MSYTQSKVNTNFCNRCVGGRVKCTCPNGICLNPQLQTQEPEPIEDMPVVDTPNTPLAICPKVNVIDLIEKVNPPYLEARIIGLLLEKNPEDRLANLDAAKDLVTKLIDNEFCEERNI